LCPRSAPPAPAQPVAWRGLNGGATNQLADSDLARQTCLPADSAAIRRFQRRPGCLDWPAPCAGPDSVVCFVAGSRRLRESCPSASAPRTGREEAVLRAGAPSATRTGARGSGKARRLFGCWLFCDLARSRPASMCGLTFELRRPPRTDALPAGPMMNNHGSAGKAAGRGGSPLERGVRRRSSGTAAGRHGLWLPHLRGPLSVPLQRCRPCHAADSASRSSPPVLARAVLRRRLHRPGCRAGRLRAPRSLAATPWLAPLPVRGHPCEGRLSFHVEGHRHDPSTPRRPCPQNLDQRRGGLPRSTATVPSLVVDHGTTCQARDGLPHHSSITLRSNR